MRRLFTIVGLFLAPILSPGAENSLDEVRRLPESNPYRALLERHAALPGPDHAALETWLSASAGNETSAPLSPRQRQTLQDFAAEMIAAAAHPPLAPREWTTRPAPDAPGSIYSARIPHVRPFRSVSRLCVKLADQRPPREALPLYAAVAQFARNQRFGDTTIHQLTATAIEGVAMAAAARRLNEYSAEETRLLGDLWKSLHPAPSVEAALGGERNQYLVPMLEKDLRPALVALLDAGSDAAGPAAELSEEQRQILPMFLPENQHEPEQEWLRRVKAHPRGVDGCIADLLAAYDRSLARHLGLSADPSAPSGASASEENAYLATMMPTLGKVARTLRRADTETVMLQAAVHHRLAKLGAAEKSAAPPDPWCSEGAGFAHKETPYGAFFLRSRYEVEPGQPVVYKFAAPDAGFVRVSAKP